MMRNAIFVGSMLLMTAGSALAEEMPSIGFVKTAPAPVSVWKPIKEAAPRDDVVNTLVTAGWPTSEVDKQLPSGETYQLFSRAAQPGLISYLAVPKGGMGAPIEFSPDKGVATAQPAAWGITPSADEIRQEIVNGMQAAVDALCGMKARPSTIRAQASAFGIVEVEATWTAAEVCEG